MITLCILSEEIQPKLNISPNTWTVSYKKGINPIFAYFTEVQKQLHLEHLDWFMIMTLLKIGQRMLLFLFLQKIVHIFWRKFIQPKMMNNE